MPANLAQALKSLIWQSSIVLVAAKALWLGCMTVITTGSVLWADAQWSQWLVRGQLRVVPKYVSVLAPSVALCAALSAYRIAMALPGTADGIVIGSFVFLCLLTHTASPIVDRLATDFRSRYGFALV